MANILWIEDESVKIYGLVRPLEKDGHQITTAIDKRDALEKLKEATYDLIILDIIIPEGEEINTLQRIEPYVGIQVLEYIKETQQKVPVIVLTIVNDEEPLSYIRGYGDIRILHKGSYLPSDLKAEVYDVLGIS